MIRSVSDQKQMRYNRVVAHELPIEIRDQIFRLVLKQSENDPSMKPTPGDTYTVFQATGPTFSDFSLLLVSRQTFLETYATFYRFNKLHFGSTKYLFRFLRNIGFARRQQITRIAFGWTFHCCNAKATFRLLKTCSNLRTVEIILDSRRNDLAGAWDIGALREVRGMELSIVLL
jgi:hypothetical protein